MGRAFDIGERNDAGGAGRGGAEDRGLGEFTGIVEHVADGDDVGVDRDVALEGRLSERSGGREQGDQSGEGDDLHCQSPQRIWLTDWSISSAPVMTRAF